MKAKVFSSDQERQIVQGYDKMGLAALAKHWHCMQITIKGVLARYGIALKDPYHFTSTSISDSDELEIIKRYQSGTSIESLKKEFKINHRRIVRIFSKRKVEKILRTSQKQLSLETIEQIINCFYAGLTMAELSDEFGMANHTLRGVLRAHGVALRSKGELNTLSVSLEKATLMKEAYERTLSLRLVGRQFGYCNASVKKAILEYYPDFVLSDKTPSNEQIWMHEYGEAKGREMYRRHMRAIAKKNRGRLGPRPSNTSGGYGVKGWYNGFFFRSLKELSFILANETSHKIESAEGLIRVKYRDGDRFRYYYPDFVLDDKDIVEVKDKYSMSDTKVLAKMKALKRFCKGTRYTCRIEDISLNQAAIKTLYLEGKIVFSSRHDEYVKETYGTR